jgi:hypothetical protein
MMAYASSWTSWQVWKHGVSGVNWKLAVGFWAFLALVFVLSARPWVPRPARVLSEREIQAAVRRRRLCGQCYAAPHRLSPGCSACGHIHPWVTWTILALSLALVLWLFGKFWSKFH